MLKNWIAKLLKSVPANGHTEALGMARFLMGTPDVEKLMARMMYRTSA
ncbi:MAG: hypothetical protein JRJ85_17405 [Deltaproteobacteria bacterium]|nr:hypothetical protein [Deltaproteobacteria bacterium]